MTVTALRLRLRLRHERRRLLRQHRPGPAGRLTRLAWRAELLADIAEKTEEVARRFESGAYAGAGPQVARSRGAADRLKVLAGLRAGTDVNDPAATADLAAALGSAPAVVREMESGGAPGEEPAAATAV